MRLGVSFTATYAKGISRQRLVDDARATEQAGFDSMWFFDALGRGSMHPDPLQAICVAAAGATTLAFGTCILQVPLRHPAELAQRVLTTQMACDGRFTLGVGAGSTRTDFDLVGAIDKSLGDELDELAEGDVGHEKPGARRAGEAEEAEMEGSCRE